MKATINNEDYAIKFYYEPMVLHRIDRLQQTTHGVLCTEGETVPQPAPEGWKPDVIRTHCIITRGEDTLVTAYVTQNSVDQFCRATGRKLALSKALQKLTEEKRVRRQFWQAYFDGVKHTHNLRGLEGGEEAHAFQAWE